MMPLFTIAAPEVINTDGQFSHGQSVTISGSGFGVKSTAAPKKWDTFDDGTSTGLLSDHEPNWVAWWPPPDRYGVSYTNITAHSGPLSVMAHITDGEFFGSNYYTIPAPATEMFVSYWWRTRDADDGDDTTTKMARISSSEEAGGGGVYTGAGNMTLGGTFNIAEHSGPYCAWNNGETGELFFDADVARLTFPTMNSWFRVDMYKKLSTPGQHDGASYVKMFVPQVDEYPTEANNYTAMTRASGQTFLLDTFLLGAMDGGVPNHDYEVHTDDVYIDTTPARIEICDTATWAARTHCEVQLPTTWSTTQATATINRGSFGAPDPAYLYIVDSTNTANANGYAITFGSASPDTTAPSEPSGLSVM